MFAEGGNDRDNPEKDILSACGGEIPFSDEIMKGLLRDAHSGSWCARAGSVQPARETVGGNLWNSGYVLPVFVAGLFCWYAAQLIRKGA